MLFFLFSISTKDLSKSLNCIHLLFCFYNNNSSLFFIMDLLLLWSFTFIMIVTLQSSCAITNFTFWTSFVRIVDVFFYITHATIFSVHLFSIDFHEKEFQLNKIISNKQDANRKIAADVIFVILMFTEHRMENIWEVKSN